MLRSVRTQLAATFLAVTIALAILATKGLPPDISLHDAATTGDLTEVERNLAWGADVNSADRVGFTALHEAAFQGHLAVAEILIAAGADVNATSTISATFRVPATPPEPWDGRTAVALNGQVRETPLHWAAARGHRDMAALLLAHGANVNAVAWSNPEGFRATALSIAVERGHKDAAELLHSHEARSGTGLASR